MLDERASLLNGFSSQFVDVVTAKRAIGQPATRAAADVGAARITLVSLQARPTACPCAGSPWTSRTSSCARRCRHSACSASGCSRSATAQWWLNYMLLEPLDRLQMVVNPQVAEVQGHARRP